MTPRVVPLEERFWSKVDRSRVGGCWPWVAAMGPGEYGLFRLGGMQRAHRVAYEMTFGRIPEGLVLDHLCRNHSCVNPAHLEPVTVRENTLRGIAPSSVNAAKSRCDNGHEFDIANTRLRHGSNQPTRKCRACDAERARRYRMKRKEMQPA